MWEVLGILASAQKHRTGAMLVWGDVYVTQGVVGTFNTAY